MKSFVSAVPSLVVSLLLATGCAAERRDDTSATDSADLSVAPAKKASAPGHLSLDCTPKQPHAYRSIQLEIDALAGSFSYVALTGDALVDQFATHSGATFAEELPGHHEFGVPPHALTLSQRHGEPNTRTDGMTWLDVQATGTFLRGGSFRTPLAAITTGVTLSATLEQSVYDAEVKQYSLYQLSGIDGKPVVDYGDTVSCQLAP